MISKIQKIKGKDGKEKLMKMRSVTNRKLQRQAMKNQLGSNKVRKMWQADRAKLLAKEYKGNAIVNKLLNILAYGVQGRTQRRIYDRLPGVRS